MAVTASPERCCASAPFRRFSPRTHLKLEDLWIGSPDTPLSSPGTTSIDQRSIGNLGRVGLNYRF
jgi:hypothetical protein